MNFILLSFIFTLFSCNLKTENVKSENLTFENISSKKTAEKIVLDTTSILEIKNLGPKEFIETCEKNYNKNAKLNFVTFSGDFEENWVKKNDLEYLISKINSKQKCCGYMNIFSSFISAENAEVGGFALIFLKSFKEKSVINLGLNSNPKYEKTDSENIITWYENYKKNKKPNG